MAEMRDRGVDVAEYMPCVHLLTYVRERFGTGEGLCPVAEGIAARTLALPFFPGIEPEDQEYVAETLRSIVG
jgi:perosamine synthetase